MQQKEKENYIWTPYKLEKQNDFNSLPSISFHDQNQQVALS